jgi:hypothetical protein
LFPIVARIQEFRRGLFPERADSQNIVSQLDTLSQGKGSKEVAAICAIGKGSKPGQPSKVVSDESIQFASSNSKARSAKLIAS